MGNTHTTAQLHPTYINIYKKLIQIQTPQTRVQMIETCFAGPEYVSAAKMAGVYGYLLTYVSQVRSGLQPPVLPGESSSQETYRNGVPHNIMSPPQITTQHGEHRSQQNPYMSAQHGQSQQIAAYQEKQQTSWQQIMDSPQNKAISYFSSCLDVLGIGENDNLTEERLRHAYKRSAARVHPDKGGTEQEFEAVTRAYAYLAEILKRMQGRKVSDQAVSAPSTLVKERRNEMKDVWTEDTAPVTIDPNNMNMNAFNKLFEQARIPDPDDDGYGDWMKDTQTEAVTGPKFSGEFNREVFNRSFTDSLKPAGANKQIITHPRDMALTLSADQGVELGRERPQEYTAAPNAKMQFTDLRAAYTTRATFSNEIANVRIEDRDLKKMQAERESAPSAFSHGEAAEIAAAEERWRQQEAARARRAAEESSAAQAQFDRVKRYMLVNKS